MLTPSFLLHRQILGPSSFVFLTPLPPTAKLKPPIPATISTQSPSKSLQNVAHFQLFFVFELDANCSYLLLISCLWVAHMSNVTASSRRTTMQAYPFIQTVKSGTLPLILSQRRNKFDPRLPHYHRPASNRQSKRGYCELHFHDGKMESLTDVAKTNER